ncbi:MAG: hypothetical protein FJW88_03475 [Actinobacteria bacterium]|nr:hypothetical protein [Actinomycetota bacterium]
MTTDPFRDLRLPPEPLEPRAEFRAALRERMARALIDPDGGTPMAATNLSATTRVATITPYLCCANAREAIHWYGDAFGAEVVGDVCGSPDRPDSVGHAELRIGGSTLNLSDEWPEGGVLSPTSRGGSTTSFVLAVRVPADVDVVYSRAVELGAQPERPPTDQPYGSRAGWLIDPFGHRWSISAALVDRTDGTGRPEVHGSAAGVTQAQDLWNEVGYYVISRPDLDRAKAFYGGLFGWEFAPENETPSGRRAAHVTSSRVPFGLTDDTDLGLLKPWFRVPDLQAAIVRVRELGGEVVTVERYATGGAAVCRDDQGVEFDLHEPAPGY